MSLAEKRPDAHLAQTNRLGADLRALRKSRHMTLQQVADAVDRSVGWLSQIERGLTEPALSDLRRLVALYDVPLSLLFRNEPGPAPETAHVVRRAHRRQLGSQEEGFVEELLSPDLGGAFEVFRSEFAAGASLPEPILRDTEEAGYIVSGQLDMRIAGRWHSLEAGDSFRFRHEPYQWRNPGTVPAVVIWVVAPPIY
ncbi:MAG: helix-turn-helix domain-containing protein [Pseudomonadota bacterium]